MEGLLDLIKLERLDDGFDLFHGGSSTEVFWRDAFQGAQQPRRSTSIPL
jgi:hypothetical protein